MKLVNICQFEAMNPNLAINVLKYNKDPIKQNSENIFKNPFVDLVYRSTSTGSQIYLLFIEEGNISFNH